MADIFIYDGHISSSDGIKLQVSESNALFISHSEGLGFDLGGYGPKVGIGTITPSVPLDVEGGILGAHIARFTRVQGLGGTNAQVAINANSSDPQIQFARGTGAYAIGLNDGDNSFQIIDGTTISGGTARFTINSSGNVGIGTTNPQSLLTVSGSDGGNFTTFLRFGKDNYTAGSGPAMFFKTSPNTTLDRYGVKLGAIRKGSGTAEFVIEQELDNGSGGAGGLSETLRITSFGNVGIGTSTATAKLEVIGDISGSGAASFETNLKVDGKVAIAAPNNTSTADLIIGDGTTNVNVTLFGNEDSATQASLWFGDVASAASPHYGGSGFVYDGNDNHLTIRKGGSTNNLFTIDADNGNVGIGKVSGDPTAKLEVVGDMIVGGIETGNIISSPQYFSGFAGSGFRIQSGSTGVKAEFDNLSVRGSFQVYELVANQVRATNGSLWISNAGKIISSSQLDGFGGASWPVSFSMFFETGSDTLDHGFVRGDVIRSQKFDGSNVFQSNMIVCSRSDSGSIIAALEDQSTPPSASMDFVRIGHTFDEDRDAAIYLTAEDTNAPYIDVIDGVDSHTAFAQSDKIKVRLGNLAGITDVNVGGALSGYGLYSENVYLTGTIKAVAGEIGGFGLNATSISSSNDNLILRSTGQITASDFLFDGSGTIDGDVTIGSNVTIAGQLSVGALPNLPSDESLVGYWNFDQGTGSLIRDQVGSLDSNGNRYDIPTVDPDGTPDSLGAFTSESISGIAWKRDSAGSAQYAINVTSSFSSSFGNACSGSISFWLNTDLSTNGDDQSKIFGENGENAGFNKEDFFFIDQQPGGQIRMLAYSGSGGTGGFGTGNEYVSAQGAGTSLTILQDLGTNAGSGGGRGISSSLAAANSGSKGWAHWVINWGSGSNFVGNSDHAFRIYINGEKVSHRIMTGSDARINFRPYNQRLAWIGQKNDDATIDEIRIYNSVLTPNEVRALYLSPAGMNTGTTVTGDQIQTGQIRSNNWNNDTDGSMIDLTNGRMHLGGLEANAKLHFDGTNLSVAGTVSASAGNIGGWKIESDKFVDGSDTIRLEPNGTYVISSSEFQVDQAGSITASSANFSGNVTSSQALIGGWTVDSGSISSNNAKLDAAGKLSLSSSKFTGTGIQLENNSGAPRAYIGDGNLTGSFIQYDETNGVRLGPAVTLAFGSTMLPGENILNDFSNLSITDPWVASATPNYYPIGEATDNEVSTSVGPHGLNEKVWVASPDSDTDGGGWMSDWFEVDHSQTYQFSVYVKFPAESRMTGSWYMGARSGDENIFIGASGSQNPATNPGQNSAYHWPKYYSVPTFGPHGHHYDHAHYTSTGQALAAGAALGAMQDYQADNSGITNWNPYFMHLTGDGTNSKGHFTQSIAEGGLGGQQDRWYLCVGYIHGSSSLYNNSVGDIGGMYDTVTGRKVRDGNDFIWGSGSQWLSVRSFHNHDAYGADDDTPYTLWAKPAVKKVTQATTDISSFIDIGSAIATGQYSGSSTFITSTSIFSPNIAGTDGYISNKLTVGTAGSGVTLDGTNKKLFLGTGDWKGSNTPFIARDSGSDFLTNGSLTNGTTGWTIGGSHLTTTNAPEVTNLITNGYGYQAITNLVVGLRYDLNWIIPSSTGTWSFYVSDDTTYNTGVNGVTTADTSNTGFNAGQKSFTAHQTTAYIFAFNIGGAGTVGTWPQLSVTQEGVFSLGDKFAWDGSTLQITGSLSLTAGDASASISQLNVDSASFSTLIADHSSSAASSITQNADSITAAVSVNDGQASSISQLQISTGAIELEVNSLNEASGALSGSVVELNLTTASINLSVASIQGQVTQSQFNNLDWSQGYSGWNWHGSTGNYQGLNSVGENLDGWTTGSMSHLNGIAYTSGSLAGAKMFEVVSGSNLSGSRFGRALEARSSENGNQTWVYGSEAVPIDTDRVYQGRVRVRMAHVGDNGETYSGFYAGFACLDQFGNQISESPGTHRYFTVGGKNILPSDPYTWNEYSGSISRTTTEAGGAGSEDLSLIGDFIGNNGRASGTPTTHNVFKTGTKFVRPMMIFNYSNKDTAMQVDGFTIEDVTPTVQSSASISITDTQVQTNVSNISGNSSTITQNADGITLAAATASDVASLAINPQGVQISGSNLEFSGSSFYFGIGAAQSGSGAFISGSNGNIEISSSNFHIQASGSAIFSGSISASDGDIGGWSLQPGTFSSNNITLDSANEIITLGSGNEITLDGDGSGHVAGGNVAWTSTGDLTITDASIEVNSLPSLPSSDKTVRHYAFDAGHGTTVLDQGGTAQNGTLTVSTGTPNGLPTWISGSGISGSVSGKALSFNAIAVPHSGSGQHIVIPTLAIDSNGAGNAFAISFWARKSSITDDFSVGSYNYQRIFRGGSSNNFIDLGIASGKFRWNHEGTDNTGGNHSVFNSSVTADTEWHHYVLVSKYELNELYIDGELEGTDAWSATGNSAQNYGAGFSFTGIGQGGDFASSQYSPNYGDGWNGALDEVRIYTGSLSPNEIKGLYLNPAGDKGTKITGDQITTGKIKSNNWNDSNAGSLIDLDEGTVHLGGSGSNANFYFNEAGDLSITGSITAESSTITGNIYADNIVTNSGSIGGWTISADSIESGSSNTAGGDSIRLWGSPTVVGTNAYQSTQTKLQGLSIQWHESNNAGHIVFGDVLTDANGAPEDPNGTPAYNGWKGIQAQKYNEDNPYFQLAFNTDGAFATKNIIAGWEFTEQKIINYNGTEPLLELKNTTTAGDFIISASNFQVDTAGAFTASAGLIEGDVRMRGKLEVLDPTGVQTHTLYARGTDFSNISTHPARVQGGNNISETSFTIGQNLVILSESVAGVLEKRHKSAYDTHNSIANGNTLAGILMGTSTYSDVNGNATTLEGTDVVLIVSHDASKISTNLHAALKSVGGTNPHARDSSQNVQAIPTTATSRTPYALIGQQGLGHGNGFEKVGRYDEADHPSGSAEITAFFKNGQISANTSTGTEIAGSKIKTGEIQSNNWTGLAGAKGTLLDLDNGKLIMRTNTEDYLNFNAAAGTANIAGWTFNQQKFYSNSSNEVRGININKNEGIRGRAANEAYAISGSNTFTNLSFGIQLFENPAETVAQAKSGCFPIGTRILLSNGTWKAIQNIEIGDLVRTKEGTNVPVLDSFIWNVNKEMTMYTNKELTVTDTHPLWINGKWQTADKLGWDNELTYVDNLYYLQTENNYIVEGTPATGIVLPTALGVSIKNKGEV